MTIKKKQYFSVRDVSENTSGTIRQSRLLAGCGEMTGCTGTGPGACVGGVRFSGLPRVHACRCGAGCIIACTTRSHPVAVPEGTIDDAARAGCQPQNFSGWGDTAVLVGCEVIGEAELGCHCWHLWHLKLASPLGN